MMIGLIRASLIKEAELGMYLWRKLSFLETIHKDHPHTFDRGLRVFFQM